MSDYATYGWIIDRDVLGEDDNYEYGDGRGVVGPGIPEIDPEIEKALKRGEGRPFRLYDDDGELYYTGRIIVPSEFHRTLPGYEQYLDLNSDAEEHFGPLWDYGAPNAGATDIRYRHQTTGKWTTL